jgi:hypothetical protein
MSNNMGVHPVQRTDLPDESEFQLEQEIKQYSRLIEP